MRQETVKKSRRLTLVSMGVFMALNAHGNTVVLSQANQSSANNVNIAQTVGANQNKIAGEVVAQGMEKALLERLAVEQGVKNAEKIKQIADDSTIGKGLAQSLQCNVTANVRYSEHKIGTSSANASNQQKSFVANYALKSSANKRAERHERHKMLYCGPSEIRNGECLHGIYNKPNIDTNFSNLMAQNTMSEQEMEGAYDYLRHLVDISQTVSPECQTHECNLIRDKETQYNTYANAVQSVFLNLIHERTNPIDPVRALKIVAIDQNPDELSGDNWRPEHGTVYPDGRNIVRGGDHQSTGLGGQCQTAEDNTPVTTNHPIIVIGDDIAELNTELNGKHNIEIYTKKGASPKDVLKMLTELVAKKRAWAEKTIKDDPQHKDKTDKEKEILIRNFVDEYWGQAIIMISTGVINDPDLQERKHIEEIIEILGGFNALNPQKGEKGSTALAGMPLVPTDSENKDVKKNQKQLPQEKRQALNDWLAQTANKHKVGFSGTFTSDDGKLPNDKRLLAVFGRGLAKNGTSLCILNADSNECLDVEETNKQDKVVVKTAQSAKKALQNCAVELAGGVTSTPDGGTPVDLGSIKGKPFAGFGARIDGYIKEASQMYGIDEKTLRGFVKMEGGWTGAMSPTGALGVGQFIQSTWDELAEKPEGKKIGMTVIGNRKRKANDPRRDARINTLATALLMVQNTKILKSRDIDPNPANLYMAHNMGAGFVLAIHGKMKFTAKTRYNINVNGGAGMTPQQFIVFQQKRFLQHYADANFIK